jgi:predicted acetyltransferase
MTRMSDITIRAVTSDEYPAFVTAFIEGFSDDLPSEGFADAIRTTLPPERTLAAFDDGAIVGTFGGYDLTLTVPGGSLPMEGTTVVTVFPTHRRMGLLRSMMDTHLANAADAGYAIAGLWASETDIYGRFGYGIATFYKSYKFASPGVQIRDEVPVDRVRRVAPDVATDLLPPVFEAVLAARPGMYARTSAWWATEVFLDEDWMKRGRTTKRYVVHDGPDGVDGYAIYRQKAGESDDGHADGKVLPIEVIAATPRAHASLWAYLTRIDGCPNIDLWNVPLDDPLPWMAREPRRVRVTSIGDGLWIRILDVAAALHARTYEEDGDVVFAITDPFRPSTGGTYRMSVRDGSASVARVSDAPEITMGVEVLGALYLGGQDAFAFSAAGRIEGDASATDRLQRIFRTVRPPWCNQVF